MRSPSSGDSSINNEETSSTAKTKPLLERFLRCSTRYFAFQRQTLLSVGVLFILMMIFVRLGKPPPGVCVFDLEVLMTKDFKPTSYAVEAQNLCKLRGHDIAVYALNTIDENYPYEIEFLKSYFPKIWTPTLLQSHALQIKPKATKKESFEAISSYYDRSLHCTVLISNRMPMSEVINDYGINYVQVSEPDDSIERIGVTKSAVELAILSLYTTCQDVNNVEDLEKGNIKKGMKNLHQAAFIDCVYISSTDFDCVNSISSGSSKTEDAMVCGCTKKKNNYFVE